MPRHLRVQYPGDSYHVLLGSHGLRADMAEDRIDFQQGMEHRRSEDQTPNLWTAFRRGRRLGAADFVQRLSERMGRPGRSHEQARQRHATDEHRAERSVKERMHNARWTEAELAARAKGDSEKAALAALLRRQTPMTRARIARRLYMCSASYVSRLTKGNHPP